MTAYEFNLKVEAYQEHKIEKEEMALTVAYLNAGWQRAKKMPKLDKYLRKESKKQKRQTPQEMFDQIMRMNAALEGEVS